MRQSFISLLGLVVLLSTTGLPRVQHLCGGIVQSVGIWVASTGCSHENTKASDCVHGAELVHEASTHQKSCCLKPIAQEETKDKGCCSDQVDWKPAQVDLAIGDIIVLTLDSPAGLPSFYEGQPFQEVATQLLTYVRPPPLTPLVQSRRRALLQVYRC